MAITQQRITLEEFLKLPGEKPALEFHEGTVTSKVSPKSFQGRIQGKLAEFINLFSEPLRLAIAFTETRSTFGGSSFVPDVGVYRWDRVPRDARGKQLLDFTMPWDIAIEIRAPDQTHAAQVRRCRWYVANGVSLALLVDPHRETVTLFRSDGIETVLRGDDPIDLGTVLPGFRLTPAELFATLYSN